MSAMLRFKSVEDFEKFKRETGVREARPISGKHSAAPVRRAPPTAAGVISPRADPYPALRLAPVAAEPKKESEIERRFAQQIRAAGLPEPEREWFHVAGRNLTLDFAWPALKIGVEVQGMAHRIKAKFNADIEKRALALLLGWRILEVNGDAVRNEIGIGWLKELFNVDARKID